MFPEDYEHLGDDNESIIANARLVKSMTETDGWAILTGRLKEIEKFHMETLLNTPVVPDSLGELALAQSKVAAVRMLFQEAENFISAVPD